MANQMNFICRRFFRDGEANLASQSVDETKSKSAGCPILSVCIIASLDFFYQ
jgi:hypothetical protein